MRTHGLLLISIFTAGSWLASGEAASQTSSRQLLVEQLRKYQPATLAQVFAAQPRNPEAAVELAPEGEWFHVDALITGEERTFDPAAAPLIRAWGGGKGPRSEHADALVTADFPVLAFEEAGKTYWLLMGPLPVMSLDRPLQPQKMTLFVQRLGFVAGKPFPIVFLLGPTEDMRQLLSGEAPPPLPPGPYSQWKDHTRVGTYSRGELQFEYFGKTIVMPIDTRKFPFARRGLFNRGSRDDKSLDIAFCRDARNCAVVRIFDIDSTPGKAPDMSVNITLDGTPLDVASTRGCKTVVKSATAELFSAIFDCTDAPETSLTTVGFSARR